MQYFKDTNPKLPWKSCDCFTRQVCTERHRLGTRCTAVNSACNPTCLELTVWKNKAEEKQVYKEKVKAANTMGKKWSLGEMFVVIWNELKSGSFQARGARWLIDLNTTLLFSKTGICFITKLGHLSRTTLNRKTPGLKPGGYQGKKCCTGNEDNNIYVFYWIITNTLRRHKKKMWWGLYFNYNWI